MHILLVEDQEAIRSMIETLVQARGHEVRTAVDGAGALEEARSRVPDLVLLDLMMPGQFDGIEVCRRLRAEASTQTIPVVIVTAAPDDATRRAALDAGATAYFTKPFSPMALLEWIDQLDRER